MIFWDIYVLYNILLLLCLVFVVMWGRFFYVLIKCDVMNLQTVINGRDVLWLDFSPAAV